MELYNMEQLSKMSDAEKEAVAKSAEQDFDNGIREPALTTLKTLSDMGSSFAVIALLDYLTGGYNNLIGKSDLPAAKALLNGSAPRLKPGDRAYFTAMIALQEFDALLAQRDANKVTFLDIYCRDSSFSSLRQTFTQGFLGLYQAKDASGLDFFLAGQPHTVPLLTCGFYNLHWGELAQICCWLLENASDQLNFDPRALLTDTLKSAARQACLHPYLMVWDAEVTLATMIRRNVNLNDNEFPDSEILFFNPQLCAAFFEQYRLAATLPLYDVHAQLLQEIRHHLSFFKDFEGYDPNVFPKKKLFGNPAPASQWDTYLRERQKYE